MAFCSAVFVGFGFALGLFWFLGFFYTKVIEKDTGKNVPEGILDELIVSQILTLVYCSSCQHCLPV